MCETWKKALEKEIGQVVVVVLLAEIRMTTLIVFL